MICIYIHFLLFDLLTLHTLSCATRERVQHENTLGLLESSNENIFSYRRNNLNAWNRVTWIKVALWVDFFWFYVDI